MAGFNISAHCSWDIMTSQWITPWLLLPNQSGVRLLKKTFFLLLLLFQPHLGCVWLVGHWYHDFLQACVCLIDYKYSLLSGDALNHLYWRDIGGSLGPSNTSTLCSGSSCIWQKKKEKPMKTWKTWKEQGQRLPNLACFPPLYYLRVIRSHAEVEYAARCESLRAQNKHRGWTDYRHQSGALIKRSNDKSQ